MTAQTPTLEFERSLAAAGYVLVAGCDEVGRGALAGPVSVGLVVVEAATAPLLAGVKDSKLLRESVREELVPAIREWAAASAVGHASAVEIDTLGLMSALRLAGSRALAAIAAAQQPGKIILDGNHDWLSLPAQPGLLFDLADPLAEEPVYGARMPVVTRIKADLACLSVAAASVLAKVERDALLAQLDIEFPQYGWAVNKGYATVAHRAAIRSGGPTPFHRQSWRLS